jgi:hypothetical protein
MPQVLLIDTNDQHAQLTRGRLGSDEADVEVIQDAKQSAAELNWDSADYAVVILNVSNAYLPWADTLAKLQQACFQSGVNSGSLHAGSDAFRPASQERPAHPISDGLARQALGDTRPKLLETVIPQVAKLVRNAAALHNERSGSTVSLSHGNMDGLNFYAVSAYPERTVELAAEPSWEMLFAYAAINLDLLLVPGHALGTWLDIDRKLHVLDVVLCPSSVGEAIRLGVLYGQKAIFDLQSRREISLALISDIAAGGMRK